MSYGLQVQSYDSGGNVITQIDTEKGYVQYVVTHIGTGSSVNVTGISPRAKILVKPLLNTAGTGYAAVQTFTGGALGDYPLCIKAGTRNGPTLKFVTSDSGAYYGDGLAWNEAFNPVACNYMIIQDVTDVTPTGDYGLQTLTAAGASSFDSRKIKYNTKVTINSIIPARSVGGAGNASDQISNNLNNYIDMSGSFWDTLGSYSGLRVIADTTSVRYVHQYQNEPSPTENFNPIYYYDNYGTIWIAGIS